MDSDIRSCPEEYRELSRRYDEQNSDIDDNNDDTDDDESRENVCEQAMSIIVKHRKNIAKFNPKLLLSYCPHYNERVALVKSNNYTLCENKKQELINKRNQQQLKRDQDDDFYDSDEYVQRRALRKKELKKRSALKFIRKRLS